MKSVSHLAEADQINSKILDMGCSQTLCYFDPPKQQIYMTFLLPHPSLEVLPAHPFLPEM